MFPAPQCLSASSVRDGGPCGLARAVTRPRQLPRRRDPRQAPARRLVRAREPGRSPTHGSSPGPPPSTPSSLRCLRCLRCLRRLRRDRGVALRTDRTARGRTAAHHQDQTGDQQDHAKRDQRQPQPIEGSGRVGAHRVDVADHRGDGDRLPTFVLDRHVHRQIRAVDHTADLPLRGRSDGGRSPAPGRPEENTGVPSRAKSRTSVPAGTSASFFRSAAARSPSSFVSLSLPTALASFPLT